MFKDGNAEISLKDAIALINDGGWTVERIRILGYDGHAGAPVAKADFDMARRGEHTLYLDFSGMLSCIAPIARKPPPILRCHAGLPTRLTFKGGCVRHEPLGTGETITAPRRARAIAVSSPSSVTMPVAPPPRYRAVGEIGNIVTLVHPAHRAQLRSARD